eukprot:SAG11_NODE_14623_length_605_cov_1.557312_1_plen_83_part_00
MQLKQQRKSEMRAEIMEEATLESDNARETQISMLLAVSKDRAQRKTPAAMSAMRTDSAEERRRLARRGKQWPQPAPALRDLL